MKVKSVEFWKWFSKNEQILFPELITDNLIDKLDDMILSLGDYSWEIREGETKENMLVISPGGDINLLPSTKEIISLAPESEYWEFQHFKPAKKWDFRFSIAETEARRMIDASDWEYVLLKFPDGTYDIIVKANTLKAIPEDYHYTALNIVLDSILGEKLRLELIGDEELVDEFSEEQRKSKTSIKFLKDQIYQLEGIQ